MRRLPPTIVIPLAVWAGMLLGASRQPGTEWHVTPGGGGDGTPDAPFGRIADALARALPGDTVVLAPGTYPESVATVRPGTAEMPIVVRGADPGDRPVLTSAGRVLHVSHAHHVFEDVTIDGQYGDGDAVVVRGPADGFLLRRVEVRRSGRDCVDLGSQSDVLIEGSLVHHCLNWAQVRRDAHGITAAAARNLTIRDTEVHTFSGDGLQLDPGRHPPGWDRVTVERCRFWLAPLTVAENGFAAGTVPGENAIDTKTWPDAPRARLVVRHTDAWGFRGGTIGNMAAFNIKEKVDATFDGVSVWDSEIAFRVRGPADTGAGVTLANVVLHDVDVGVRYEDRIRDLRIWHGTFGERVGRALAAARSRSTTPDVRNSLFMGTLPAGVRRDANRVVSRDVFVDAGAANYRLNAGTSPIDAARPIPEIPTDRDGRPRTLGLRPDLGAYEWCQSGCDP